MPSSPNGWRRPTTGRRSGSGEPPRPRCWPIAASLSEAETLSRSSVSVIDQTDYFNNRGDARMSLAYVLRTAGRPGEATTVLREALELYERKGDVADASRARADLEALSPSLE